jgi:hypothetical protein
METEPNFIAEPQPEVENPLKTAEDSFAQAQQDLWDALDQHMVAATEEEKNIALRGQILR